MEKKDNVRASIEGKPCAVCEELASGIYFGALVCLPCKSFYIRSTKDGDPNFLCTGSGNCDIAKMNRLRCQYCRFQKCLGVGMMRKEKPEIVIPSANQSLCAICGDIANGVHFGKPTCEGCKKFFRRALKEHDTYECAESGNCVVNPRTRNNCRYCRYMKAISLGMSKEAAKMGRPRKQGHLVESQEVVQDIVSFRIQDREHSQCSLNKLTHTTTTNDVLTAVPVLFSSATLHSNQLINSPSCLASPDMSKHTASTSLHERSNSVGQAEFKSNHTAPHPLDLSSVSSAATKDMGITLVAGPNAHRNGTIPHAYIGKKQENLEAKVCETKSRLQGILEYNRRVNEDDASDRVNNISSNGHHCEQLEVIETKNPKVCGIPSTENNSISKKEYEISDYVRILTYINEYREEIKQEKVNCENQLENIPLSIVTGSSCTLGKSNNGESSPNSVQKSHTDNPSVHSQVNSGDDPQKHMLKLMNMYANDEWIKLSNYGYFEKNIEVKKKCYESEINHYVSNASTQIPYCESAHDSKAGNDPVTYSHDGLSPTLSVTENKSQSQCSGDISCSKSTQKVKERSAKRGCESLSCSEFDESYWFRLKLHVCSERKYSQLHDDVKQMARQCYERILYDTDEVQNPDYSGIIDEKPEWPGSKENLPGFLKFVKNRLVRLTHSVVTYLSSMPGNSHPTVGDRISLCRLGYFNVMLLISATDRYVPKERTFKYFFDIPIPPTGYMYSLREELLSFGERVQLLQLDEFEKAFLIAVVFFAPDWSNLEDKERVANIHNIYMEAFMLHMVKNNRDEEFFEHLVLTIIKSRELSMWFAQCVDRMPLELDEEELEDTCSRYR